MNTLLIQKREEISETRVAKMVFPSTTNHYDTLFGGEALKWMDEVAYIAATRFARKQVVTISTGQVDFKRPIPSGILVELVARVVKVGRTSLKVEVNIFRVFLNVVVVSVAFSVERKVINQVAQICLSVGNTAVEKANRIVNFVSNACDQVAQRRHFLVLH